MIIHILTIVVAGIGVILTGIGCLFGLAFWDNPPKNAALKIVGWGTRLIFIPQACAVAYFATAPLFGGWASATAILLITWLPIGIVYTSIKMDDIINNPHIRTQTLGGIKFLALLAGILLVGILLQKWITPLNQRKTLEEVNQTKHQPIVNGSEPKAQKSPTIVDTIPPKLHK